MSFYKRHMFFCTNLREDGRQCCQEAGAAEARAHAKQRIKEMGLAVVYPEGVWYTYVDKDDIDEIVEQHLVHGKAVNRLKI